MLFSKAEVLALTAIFAAVSAAPSEAISARGGDAVYQKVDPCTVDEHVVPLHKSYGKGVLPKKVEDCLVTNLGPTFINAFYEAYETEINDYSVDINGNKVDINGSIIGNKNKDNVVGDGNVVGDDNVLIDGDGNAVGKVEGDGFVGNGNGNGNGNIDHSTVNSTTSEINGNTVKDSGNKIDTEIKNNGNDNSTIVDTEVGIKDSAVDNDGNAVNNDENAIDNDANALNNDDNAVGNDGNTVGNDENTIDTGDDFPPVTKRGLAALVNSKRHVESCFGLKCMGSVNKVLPCIFTATKMNNPAALLACGVPKSDLCSCTACLPADVADYVDDHCKGGPSPLDNIPVSEDLVDADFVESTDNNVRAFLGLVTKSELEGIRNYEKTAAARIGARAEDTCTLGTACGESCGCCLGTCGTKMGALHCYGLC